MKALHMLLVEDDNDDIELLQDALQENKVAVQLHVIRDGGSMADYLASAHTIPDVIVMDFNLPKVHGRDVLKSIRSATRFKAVPVIILTTSSSSSDIDYAYKEGASNYLIKPTTTEGFKSAVNAILDASGYSVAQVTYA